MSSALEYWVWLGLAFGSGNGRTDEIIRQFESIEEFYETQAYRTFSPLLGADREHLRATKLDTAKQIVEAMHEQGIFILTPENPCYPERLHNIYGKPCVLYVDGALGDLDNELAIAMVGTRKCSDYGYRAANKIASELAQAGAVIISGLAAGIDTVCHTAAVKNDQKTIAVLGCGIDTTYPVQNKTLRELIVKNGAVISEFAPGTPPRGANFPIRNRIISALSMGVVVVEAGQRSGSLITARMALEQGKDIFAVPNTIFDLNANGTFQLLRQGAIPVSCALDVLEEYRYRFADVLQLEKLETAPPVQAARAAQPVVRQMTLEPVPPVAKALPEREQAEPENVTEESLLIYRLLSEQPTPMEELAARLQKPTYEVLTALTELEILGLVQAQSGGRYKRILR